MDCIFCKIASRKIPTDLVYEDEEVIAFKDINSQAPVHLLIVPKKHIKSIMEIGDEDKNLVNKIFKVAQKLAQDNGLSSKGFRLVINTGDDGGQSVKHLHVHLLGGRTMKWPPG